MRDVQKFKEYMSICGIKTVTDLHKYGEYPKSVQWLRTVLRDDSEGIYFKVDEMKLCYKTCNRARAKIQAEQAEREKINEEKEYDDDSTEV